ncbi:hypothetical protein PTKIN_Ptkin14bG0025600 [Pterospermum kingtungense]
MASQVPQILVSHTAISTNMENRPKADYHPSIWGDVFLSCPDKDVDATTELKHEQLKEEVRRMLLTPLENSNQKLTFIDAVQRLGMSYHFEKEIEDALETMYHDSNDVEINDLYTTALRFRLLREHGFHVSCEAFNMFKDGKGNFKSSLTSDVRGLLELYEACYLRVHGEDILEEAISYATTHLNLAVPTLDYPGSEQVRHALERSIRRDLPRVEARRYISIYKDLESPNKALLEFAKIDFNLLQHLLREELSEICRWWKDLDFARKLPYARDRVVECYIFWSMGVYFEPQYSLFRKVFAKAIAMISIVDDTYDSYGIYDELIVYTDAIQRWDIKCMDQLPDYMQISYKALLDVYEEMKRILPEEKRYRVEYARKEMIRLAQAYMLEAKWTHQKYKPTFDEFRANQSLSTGYDVLAITALVGMGDVVTLETFKWATNDPKIIRACAIICRFMDDIAEHKFNHKRENDFSGIQCYMEQFGVSAQEAYDEFNKHIESAWKDINEEFLKPTSMPAPVLNPSLNLARAIDVFFKDGDGYSHVGKVTKGVITSLLINPIPL